GSDTSDSAALRSDRGNAGARPRWRTRRCRWQHAHWPTGPVPDRRTSANASWLGLIDQFLIDQRQFFAPDALVDGSDVLVADDAPGVDEEGLRRAIHAQVQAQATLGILDVQLVGVVQLAQPLLRRFALVLVVDAVNHHAGLSQLVQHRMFVTTGRAPGGPDIDQCRLALEVIYAQGALGIVQRRQTEGRERLADQRRGQLGGIEEQTAIQEYGNRQECQQRQQQQQTSHALTSCMPRASRTRVRTLIR